MRAEVTREFELDLYNVTAVISAELTRAVGGGCWIEDLDVDVIYAERLSDGTGWEEVPPDDVMAEVMRLAENEDFREVVL